MPPPPAAGSSAVGIDRHRTTVWRRGDDRHPHPYTWSASDRRAAPLALPACRSLQLSSGVILWRPLVRNPPTGVCCLWQSSTSAIQPDVLLLTICGNAADATLPQRTARRECVCLGAGDWPRKLRERRRSISASVGGGGGRERIDPDVGGGGGGRQTPDSLWTSHDRDGRAGRPDGSATGLPGRVVCRRGDSLAVRSWRWKWTGGWGEMTAADHSTAIAGGGWRDACCAVKHVYQSGACTAAARRVRYHSMTDTQWPAASAAIHHRPAPWGVSLLPRARSGPAGLHLPGAPRPAGRSVDGLFTAIGARISAAIGRPAPAGLVAGLPILPRYTAAAAGASRAVMLVP